MRIVGLESDVATAKKDEEDATAKTEELAFEVQRYRNDALKAQSNYKRKLDLHQTTFAMGESIAHLHALWFGGKLVRRVDGQGVYRFALA